MFGVQQEPPLHAGRGAVGQHLVVVRVDRLFWSGALVLAVGHQASVAAANHEIGPHVQAPSLAKVKAGLVLHRHVRGPVLPEDGGHEEFEHLVHVHEEALEGDIAFTLSGG